MTLLSVVKAVASVVGVEQPQSVFSNIVANRTMQEMLDLANEMAQRISYDNRDWTLLRQVATFTGDGVTEAFDLPADWKRLLLTSNVYRSMGGPTPMEFIPDTDTWLMRRALGTNQNFGSVYGYPYGEWTMLGGQIHIFPILNVGDTAFCAYASKNCITPAGGVGASDVFANDNDTFRLDERLLKLGMIWQWKEGKGAAYTEALGTFSDAMANAMGADSPAPIIIGRPGLVMRDGFYGGQYANIRW